jgi:hypothetical protein
MPVILKEVKTRHDLKTFIHLPAKIHKGEANWVPPIYSDDWIYYDPKKNKSFGYSDTILYIAYKENKPVGRIMGIINHRYNTIKNENAARFCSLECFNDAEVARKLIGKIEEWARQRSTEKLIGPFGFSDKDPQGLLIEGFEYLPVISTNYNLPYMVKLVEDLGYSKVVDLVVYQVSVNNINLELYKKVAERIMSKSDYTLMEFKTRKELKKYIRPVFALINETYSDIFGFMPFEEQEMDNFANRFLTVIDPEYVKVVFHRDVLVAFFLAMPDISEGLQKSKGYLYPVGFYHILKSQKKTKRLVLLLGAVKEGYRGLGIDSIMGIKMMESSLKGGFEYWDSHLELENNFKMRAEMEKAGGKVYKRYRVFGKNL